MRFTVLLVFLLLASFTGTALAAEAVSDPALSDVTKAIFDAVMHSNWWAAAAYGVILACIGARKLMPEAWKTGTKGDIVGVATAFLVSFAGAVGTVVVAPGAVMSAAVATKAFWIGVSAIGGYTVVHKIAGWLVGWGKLPPWAVAALKLLTLMVGSSAVKKAEAAGDAAVAADPPKGMAGDDTIREVE